MNISIHHCYWIQGTWSKWWQHNKGPFSSCVTLSSSWLEEFEARFRTDGRLGEPRYRDTSMERRHGLTHKIHHDRVLEAESANPSTEHFRGLLQGNPGSLWMSLSPWYIGAFRTEYLRPSPSPSSVQYTRVKNTQHTRCALILFFQIYQPL